MKLGAVIVAAGMSSRMGEFKPLKKILNQSVIEHIIEKFKAVDVETMVVVTGHCAGRLEASLADKREIELVFNAAYQHSDMLASAKLGLALLSGKCDKFFFTPADAPAFSIQTLRQLITADASLAKPVCNGRGGHPILIEEKAIPFIINYRGEQGMKGALRAYSKKMIAVQVADQGILFNTNTPGDFEHMRHYYRENETYIMQ